MELTKRFTLLPGSLSVLASMPAMAHSADHNLGIVAWTMHMLSSGNHLLSVMCLAVLLIAACSALRAVYALLISARRLDSCAHGKLLDRAGQ